MKILRPLLLLAALLGAAAARADLAADTGFGGDGRVNQDVAFLRDAARDVIALADGSVIVVGESEVNLTAVRYAAAGVVRLLPDGTLDTGFGVGAGDTLVVNGGRAVLLPGGRPTEADAGARAFAALALPGDGVAIAGGWDAGSATDGQLFVARLTTAGALDPAFGASGVVLLSLPGLFDPVAEALGVQSDGSIIVAGSGDAAAGPQAFVLRLTPAGVLDASFGTAGLVVVASPDPNATDFSFRALAVLADDAIVAAGGGSDVVVAKFSADGSPDPSFGDSGTAFLELGPVTGGTSASGDDAFGIAVQSDGRLVLAGARADLALQRNEAVLARVTAAGTLDPTFGADGVVLIPGSGVASAFDVVALGNDDLVVAGRGIPLVQVSRSGLAQATSAVFANSEERLFGLRRFPDDRVVAVGLSTAAGAVGGVDFLVAVRTTTPLIDEADTTPDPFTFVDVASAVGPGDTQTSAPVAIAGINAPAPVSVTGGEYQILNPGDNPANVPFTALPGFVRAGQSIAVRHVSALIGGGVTNTVLTVGGVSDTFSSTTRPADADPFDLGPDQTGVPLFTFRQSATITVSGLGTGVVAPVDVTGDDTSAYSIGCNSSFTDRPGVVRDGERVCVRHVSARTGDATVTTTLIIGGASDSFASRTVATDATPDPFAFPSQAGVAIEATVTSAAATITGLGAGVDALVEVTNGQFSVGCSGNFQVGFGTIRNGQSVCVRHTAAGTSQGDVTTTLAIGDVTATFTSTTGSFDLLPDRFDFVDQTGVELVATVTSAPVTITGLSGTAAVLVTGESDDQVSVGCTGTFTATPGRIGNGETLCVRHTSASLGAGVVTTTVQVGGRAATFTSTARTADQVPDAFVITPEDGVALATLVESEPVTITGLTGPAPVSVSPENTAVFLVNCQLPLLTEGVVRNGETICVRTISAAADGEAVTRTLTIGPPGATAVSANFVVTTGDTVPEAFGFVDVINVRQSTLVAADPVTVTGLTGPAYLTIDTLASNDPNGEYSVNCTGSYTRADGLIRNGDRLCVRHGSSPFLNGQTETIVRIGGLPSCAPADPATNRPPTTLVTRDGRRRCEGINPDTGQVSLYPAAYRQATAVSDTFASTTSGDTAPGSSAIDPWTLAALLPLLGLRRRRAAANLSR
jgi:uncharacterized delta-60 repeat protein